MFTNQKTEDSGQGCVGGGRAGVCGQGCRGCRGGVGECGGDRGVYGDL